MANIQPIQNFVLVQFVPKDGSKFFMPDGTRNPKSDCVVEDVGPDVPKNPPLEAGMKVLLRGDAKVFPLPDSTDTACIPYPVIMAIDHRKGHEVRASSGDSMLIEALQAVNGN